MLDQNTAQKAGQMLEQLRDAVNLVVFTQEVECSFCQQNTGLVKDVSELSERISYEVHDFANDRDAVEAFGVDKIPAICVVSEKKDYGVRFYGVPSGYEFTSFLEAIKAVSTGQHRLSRESREKISLLQKPVHIQVFVTPTCPYCPRAVITAHKLAVLSDNIRSDMVESIEFPHLANKYSVMGVPRMVINEDDYIEGAVPEKVVVDKIMEVVSGT
ncbi:MAG: protein disulfide oxidoreductase [Spirochaetota bacterium]